MWHLIRGLARYSKLEKYVTVTIQELTDDAWVSGPDLAPQKFLLSQ